MEKLYRNDMVYKFVLVFIYNETNETRPFNYTLCRCDHMHPVRFANRDLLRCIDNAFWFCIYIFCLYCSIMHYEFCKKTKKVYNSHVVQLYNITMCFLYYFRGFK